ncbi:phosphate ABC transporter membrane protein 2, PhoT family [Paenibacillus larvae subsp. larvae]|uniref:Phosphate transport system permease protein PstA n=1 Tax=Paenibacillus larvae subsp. larvae TaxID=147375 RepID=A0A2L1TX61_9BACL|nr:phosphate ABC transporter permease PstA [Paenibacillus larvae]AQT85844.1 phosphate ABC transporter, permease protein PstA [Paenibacillus larvae subsp. pulvifaciens]AQZ45926.1 phosphate ABC transporter, permease protein PstA [Paenibacillus larvae subsp. pulvifaciens]AVF25263.1 phosphate ABC transporter membrane protein 2, PhoT family [Paenibacillus larvae subsp. larvae]AVF30040.1 phosphate ABC transporter membrane protein 2, PhoT family [Paenibacillus larvae subsp. larvae]MBH0344558.1 phosph
MRNKATDFAATVYFWLAGFSIIGLLVWVLYRILSAGLPHLSWDFITGLPEDIMPGGGVGPMLFNSFYILFLSLVFSLPVGFGAGIYLAVYAKKNRLTEFIRISVEALASVPSIVFGLFGFLLFVQFFNLKISVLSGSLALALLNLPVLVRVTEEAFRTVPHSYWEASLALGSTRWQAIRKVLFPAALPSLITGITLVAGRALGESAILIYTAGLSVSRNFPELNPFAMGETLAVHLWYVQSEALVPDAKQIAAGSAALLLLVVLAFNLLIGIPSRIIQKRLSGGK